MNPLGTYRPGNSLLHRASPGVKLLGLAAGILVITLCVRTLPALGIAAAAVVAVYALAGIGPVTAWRQFRPTLWILLFVFVFQLIFTDWRRAVLVCGILALSVLLAAVVSLTTRTTDMLDSLTRAMSPLSKLGVRTDLIAISLALTIRTIPLIVEIAGQVDEARRARGLRPGARILVAPIVIAALRTADGFAESLSARGLD
ncbi:MULTISPECIES: energy-coupling factor transporter transmembrane component T family protein [Gordonia]|uniref:energy-coupling factor transporter transmembrane component T family protein n=1 Tax=Gordonia TaxID=2053 RepID=UPI0007EB97E2|nr:MULTISPECIES: energy-coupling factor transporter transmembrane protein EcfT [Gordonia]OBA37698.1 cobalt ABC transporter [Gordonia sp. 852002-51296_SCH5728562-b]OBC07208.1 cobalt ABC transporter [Gordonia sp. 852002-50395_SCH5434458]